ncbi:unnamed protein product [Chrysoparadoxa australica]
MWRAPNATSTMVGRGNSRDGLARMVAKKSKRSGREEQAVNFHEGTVRYQRIAKSVAEAFNAALGRAFDDYDVPLTRDMEVLLTTRRRVEVLDFEVLGIPEPKCPGGVRYLFVEDYLPGEVVKYVGNYGVHLSVGKQRTIP